MKREFYRRQAQFSNSWTSVRRDIPPEIYKTREVFLSVRESLNIFPKLVFKNRDLDFPSLFATPTFMPFQDIFFSEFSNWSKSTDSLPLHHEAFSFSSKYGHGSHFHQLITCKNFRGVLQAFRHFTVRLVQYFFKEWSEISDFLWWWSVLSLAASSKVHVISGMPFFYSEESLERIRRWWVGVGCNKVIWFYQLSW